MRHEWVVRLDYGDVRPVGAAPARSAASEVIIAIAGPDKLILRGPLPPRADGHRHIDEFDVHAGDELTFSTTWVPSHVLLELTGHARTGSRRRPTRTRGVGASCRTDLHRDVGAPLAADAAADDPRGDRRHRRGPTTSLPEEFGGERNWDYRYCWLRDAALTLESLIDAGYTEEALLWRGWLLRAVAGDPEDLQIMYAVDGARRLPERTLDHLPGYEAPARSGSATRRSSSASRTSSARS